MCIRAGSEGFDDLKFDMWTSLYSFIVGGLEKSMISINQITQDLKKIQPLKYDAEKTFQMLDEVTGSVKSAYSGLDHLRFEVIELKHLNWRLLTEKTIFTAVGAEPSIF